MELNFNISEEAAERLFLIKEIQGKDNLTGNDFARELLEKELYRLFPATPHFNEDGELVNGDAYRG